MFIWRTPLLLLNLVRRLVWISFLAAAVPIVLLAPIVALDAIMGAERAFPGMGPKV